MGKLVLVTGGARSGKSTFAEDLVRKENGSALYIATSIPFDDEMKFRVQKHRERRPSHWETVEAYKDLDIHINRSINGKSAVMVDCVTIMVTNLMFDRCVDWDNIGSDGINSVEKYVNDEISKLIAASKQANIPFVLVTNEVGMGIVPDNLVSRVFRDIAGRMNQTLARAADEVYLCVSGIPVRIK